jgi:hypothetical protein
MWLSRFTAIFFDRDNKIVRDYLMASVAVVALATIGTNILSNHLGASSEQERLKISTVAANSTGSRTYSEVRSVLDDNISTGSILSQSSRTRLDPCAIPSKN